MMKRGILIVFINHEHSHHSIATILKILVVMPMFLFFACSLNGQDKPKHPNILVIMTDQQNATMLSCTGNKWLHTPALDRLASRGIRFEKAYATNPVCVPSRFSIQTGTFPSVIGMRTNVSPVDKVHQAILQNLKANALGNVFRNAGYETYYGGKVHLPTQYSMAGPWGYDVITKNERDSLAITASDFLLNRKRGDNPFLLFVSFINPHDICYDAIQFGWPDSDLAKTTPPDIFDALKIPKEITEKEFYDSYCPPLPSNHQPMIGESYAVDSFLNYRDFHKKARNEWTDKDWRLLRWAYARLTERVDSLIGIVLNALDKSELKDSTIIVFTSDHGEMDGAHKLEAKSFFYEESIRIPFIVSYSWLKDKGRIDSNHLVSNGLDLLPTLCDMAGVSAPEDLPGKSLTPLFKSSKMQNWRDHIFIENYLGYLIHTSRYKYELDDKDDDKIREVFSDLQLDPGETHNMIHNSEYAKTIGQLRKELLTHLAKAEIKIIPPGDNRIL